MPDFHSIVAKFVIYAYKWMCFREQCDQMYFRNLCDRVHFCNRCDQMHFHDRCQKDVFLHTSGHTKFAICNDFDRWHCSLVIVVLSLFAFLVLFFLFTILGQMIITADIS